ncbi:MAG: hypothetical protein ACTSWZ_07685 [Candidatus Heimdallarchaeaceae archaeon]
MSYEDFVLDLRKNEIRGKRIEDIILKREVEDVSKIEKRAPDLGRFLRKIGCEKLVWEWYGYGACITKDHRIISVDTKERKLIKEETEEYLKDIVRGKIIPESEWIGKIHSKIPVKIIW